MKRPVQRPAPKPAPRLIPPLRRCRCGVLVRIVHDPRLGEVVVDETPVIGGELIVNVDTVVGRQQSGERSLGFALHRFCREGAA